VETAIATIKLTLRKIQVFKGGSEAVFLGYEDYGLKLFRARDLAVRACARQEEAAWHGLAPEVYGGVNVYHLSQNLIHQMQMENCLFKPRPEMFGYETELVKMMEYGEYCYREFEIEELTMRLEDLFGQEIHDLRMPNVGVLNSKVVAIDFGEYTFHECPNLYK